jgi:ribosomal protein L10
MKNIFNKLHKRNYSNIAIANYVGISVETLKKAKKDLHSKSEIVNNLKNNLIFKRLERLYKNGLGGKN